MVYDLDTSWISGKFPEIHAEVNTSLPYVAIDGYFWQGEEAEEVINEIHKYWSKNEISVEQAIRHYRDCYLV